MKKLLLGCAAAALLSGPALAADLPEVVAPVAPDVVAYSWTGGYIGAHVGYAFNGDEDDDEDDFTGVDDNLNGIFNEPIDLVLFDILDPNNGDDDEDGGFDVGIRAGYDAQFGSFVIGGVVDVNYADLGGDDDDEDEDDNFLVAFTPTVPDLLYGFKRDDQEDDDVYATARLRAGFAADRVLIYGTGGLAFDFGDDDNEEFTFITTDPTAVATVLSGFDDEDDSNLGYAVGGGVEALVTNNVSVGLEYLYVNFDGFDDDEDDEDLDVFRVTSLTAGVFDVATDTTDPEHDFHSVRLTVNYRFGGIDAPVVANY